MHLLLIGNANEHIEETYNRNKVCIKALLENIIIIHS